MNALQVLDRSNLWFRLCLRICVITLNCFPVIQSSIVRNKMNARRWCCFISIRLQMFDIVNLYWALKLLFFLDQSFSKIISIISMSSLKCYWDTQSENVFLWNVKHGLIKVNAINFCMGVKRVCIFQRLERACKIQDFLYLKYSQC